MYELIVNGAFAMDTEETETEQLLADLALSLAGAPAEHGRILIGGLGLGFTAWQVLQHRVVRADVVELESTLITWARDGVTQTLAEVAADDRVQLHAADVVDVLTGNEPAVPGPWELILLDVDNGPDFLIHHENSALYRPDALRAAYERLAPDGVLAIWCQGPYSPLLKQLQAISPTAAEHRYVVHRGRRDFTYAIYTIRRDGVYP